MVGHMVSLSISSFGWSSTTATWHFGSGFFLLKKNKLVLLCYVVREI